MTVNLSLSTDSIYVGEPFSATIETIHERKDKLLFPDTTWDFSPFEIISKSWLPTDISDSSLTDYAIYELRTFELDSAQTLQLPVFRIIGEDTLPFYSNADTLHLKFAIDTLPQVIELKENTAFVKPTLPVEQIIASLASVVAILIITVLWVLFGKKIIAATRAYFIRRKFSKFEEKFQSTFNLIQEDKTKTNELVKVWKNFNEDITGKSFSAMTTKDLLQTFENQDLQIALNNLDKTIYGNKPLNNIEGHYETLKQFAFDQSEERVKEVIENAKRSKRAKRAA